MVSSLVASQANGKANCPVPSSLPASQGGLDGPPSHLPQPGATTYSSENSSKDPGNFEGNVSW